MTWRLWQNPMGVAEWEPLPGIGEGPFSDVEFEALAAAFAAENGCTVEDVKAGPVYEQLDAAGKPVSRLTVSDLEAKE